MYSRTFDRWSRKGILTEAKAVIKPIIEVGEEDLKVAVGQILLNRKFRVEPIQQEDMRQTLTAMIEYGGKSMVRAWWRRIRDEFGRRAARLLRLLVDEIYDQVMKGREVVAGTRVREIRYALQKAMAA